MKVKDAAKKYQVSETAVYKAMKKSGMQLSELRNLETGEFTEAGEIWLESRFTGSRMDAEKVVDNSMKLQQENLRLNAEIVRLNAELSETKELNQKFEKEINELNNQLEVQRTANQGLSARLGDIKEQLDKMNNLVAAKLPSAKEHGAIWNFFHPNMKK